MLLLSVTIALLGVMLVLSLPAVAGINTDFLELLVFCLLLVMMFQSVSWLAILSALTRRLFMLWKISGFKIFFRAYEIANYLILTFGIV